MRRRGGKGLLDWNERCRETMKRETAEARGMVIAIDGPAGAGKSTVARRLARLLNYRYLDTGAMYRAVTLLALRRHLNLDDAAALSRLARETEIRVDFDPSRKPPHRVIADGEDVTTQIRSREVSAHVSQVSSHQEVRKEMVKKQRAMAGGGGVVVEGRDVGTVVFPQADLKFFITASVKERARRRHREMQKEGYRISLKTVQQEMVRRDHLDSTREVNPLCKAPDALLVDTTGMTVSRVVESLMQAVREKREEQGGD